MYSDNDYMEEDKTFNEMNMDNLKIILIIYLI